MLKFDIKTVYDIICKPEIFLSLAQALEIYMANAPSKAACGILTDLQVL